MITNKIDSHKWLQIKVTVTNDYNWKWLSQMITNKIDSHKMITNKSDDHKWLQLKVIVTNDYK